VAAYQDLSEVKPWGGVNFESQPALVSAVSDVHVFLVISFLPFFYYLMNTTKEDNKLWRILHRH